MSKEETDVLVIGAGPAGCVAASIIHQAGFNVRVVERERFPRFVIGESLLPRCMEALEEAKLLDAIKDKNFQVKYGAKFRRGNEVTDFNFSEQFTEGWSWTWQVLRADFDHALASALQKQNIQVDFETTVTDIQFQDSGESVTSVQRKGHEEKINAEFIVDASGSGRVIPRILKLEGSSQLEPRKAVFAHVKEKRRDAYEEPNRIIVVVYEPSAWVWIIPLSNGVTSVGFVGNPDFFQRNGESEAQQFKNLAQGLPYLKERFGDAVLVFEPRKLEAWSSSSERFYGNGYVLTGNVTEFLDPIFSSGVMFATASSQLAGKLLIKKLKGQEVDWEKEYTNVLQKGVDTFRSFVNAWYDGTLEKIFFTHNPDMLIKRQITSVLAGYVWDENNPFVKNPDDALRVLVRKINSRDKFLTQQP